MAYTFAFGRIFGIPLRVHITFPLILLVFGLEGALRGGAGEALMAVVLVLAVFICVILHELGHSLQVKRYGIKVRDITLLPIGGMARAESIPEKPIQEIVVAISGPLVNFILAGLLLGLIVLLDRPLDVEGDLLASLLSINLVLGVFNLIPAFPMDGGRILRGLLALKLSYLRATHHAKNVGQAIAVFFAVLGFVNSTFIMLPFIAVFVFFGAMSEENMVKAKVRLQGKTVRDFLRSDLPVLTFDDLRLGLLPTLEGLSAPLVPVTDSLRRMGAALPVEAMRRSLASPGPDRSCLLPPESLSSGYSGGEGESLLEEVVNDFPLVEASTPAIQAYYFLKAEKEEVAGVVEVGRFLGLIFYRDLARAIT